MDDRCKPMMDCMKTKKVLLTQSHFAKAVQKFDDPKHRDWIKQYFPFKERELDLPNKGTIAFSARDWANPIWEEYIKSCETVSEKPVLDPWRIGFYKLFGGPDFEFLDKIEAVLLEEGAFNHKEVKPEATEPAVEAEVSTKGWVYLIRNLDIYKIGITRCFLDRMKQLEADKKKNGLIHAVRCTNYVIIEKELHSLYKAVRIPQSEYFRLTSAQVEEVQSLMDKKAMT